jgi:hypothetical protein
MTGLAFINPKLMKFAEKVARKHLEEQIPDPDRFSKAG